jgi:hypothetical protein
MKISIGVENLRVDDLIKILDTVKADTSFLIESSGREFTFGELIKANDKSVKDNL